MAVSDPVIFLYDEFCRVLWVSRVEPPLVPEDVLEKSCWQFVNGSDKTLFQAAVAVVLADHVSQVVDVTIDTIGRWRCWLYPARVGKVRIVGYAEKIPDVILELSDRQIEVAALFAEGLSSKEVAARLEISRATVDSHRVHIARKAGISPGSIPAWCGEHRKWLEILP